MIPTRAHGYDLAVAYRVYPRVSKSAQSLPFGDDKALLAETCLKSFKDCLGSLRVKLWAILDGCPQEYEEFFRKHISSDDLVIIKLNAVGNGATFDRQLDILLQQNDAHILYFAQGLFYWKILVKAWRYGWRSILFGRKMKLWIPVPGIATHLDSKSLSPSIDWLALIEREVESRV